MAYLYRHIRKDNDEVFYIGIGNDLNYRRAKTNQSRNAFWKNIVSKTKRVVEIMIDDISWDDAVKKEIEFISFYGRRNLGKGTLVNLTDGGEGNIGYKPSIETREKQRNYRLGKKHSEYAIQKMRTRKDSPETIEKKRIASTGRKWSLETREKLKGRKLSQEAKDAIGYKNKIRVRTQEEKDNMSKAGILRAAAKK